MGSGWWVQVSSDIKAISAKLSWNWGWGWARQNTTLLSQFYIKRMKYCKYFMPRKEILCKKLHFTGKNSSYRKQFPVTRRNFLITVKKITVKKRNILWQDKIPSHRKKFPVTGKNFFSEKDISCYRKKCHRKKFHIRGQNFEPEEDISWGKKYPFKGRNFWSQEGMPCHRKKYPFTRKKSLSKNKIFCCSKKFSVTGSNFLFSSYQPVNAFMS